MNRYKVREIIKMSLSDGWVQIAQKGMLQAV